MCRMQIPTLQYVIKEFCKIPISDSRTCKKKKKIWITAASKTTNQTHMLMKQNIWKKNQSFKNIQKYF